MRPLPSANYPPENPPGRFRLQRPYTVYDCSGEQQNVPSVPQVRRTISLNHVATGEAIAMAKAVAGDAVWFFAVVLNDGTQHVYEGTPTQAANGMGGARVRGCKALNKWVEEVSRVTRNRPVDETEPVEVEPVQVEASDVNEDDDVGSPLLPAPPGDVPANGDVPPNGEMFVSLAERLHSWTFTQGDTGNPTRAVLIAAVARVHDIFDAMGVRAADGPEVPTRGSKQHKEKNKKRPIEEE